MTDWVKCGGCEGSGIVADRFTEYATTRCSECGGRGSYRLSPGTPSVDELKLAILNLRRLYRSGAAFGEPLVKTAKWLKYLSRKGEDDG